MATVTGLTAARMIAIEAMTVNDGFINPSNHLILIQHDGTQIDAGSVLGDRTPVIIPTAADLNLYQLDGVFVQASTVFAAAGTNYPEPIAGLLEVSNSGILTFQRYTLKGDSVGGSRVWVRGRLTTTWSAWRRLAFVDEEEADLGYLGTFQSSYQQSSGPRQPARLSKELNGKYKMVGTFVNAVTSWSWTQNGQYQFAALSGAAIPPYDISGFGVVNIPGVGVDTIHYTIRGSAAGSPYIGSAGALIWQPTGAGRSGLSITVGTLTFEMPVMEW